MNSHLVRVRLRLASPCLAASGLSSGVTAIVARAAHTCAIVGAGIKCWSKNQYGQLGNDSTTDSHTPISVTDLTSGVTAIALGG